MLRAPVAVVCLVLLGGAARAGGLHLMTSHPVPSAPPPPTKHKKVVFHLAPAQSPSTGHGLFPGAVLLAVAIVVVLAAVITLVVVRALRRSGWRPRFPAFVRDPADRVEPAEAVAPDAQLVAQSALAALAALDAGTDPRTAVIAAYAGMVAALDAAGTTGVAVLTPARLLRQAATAGFIDGEDGLALTTLFERARFSTQEITAADVSHARSRLDAVRARLVVAVSA